MEVPSLVDLPVEVALRICRLLSSWDLTNCCAAIPYYRRILNSPTGIRLLRRDLSTWKWMDQRLSRLILSPSQSLCFNNLVDALRYRHELETAFHEQWASFSFYDELGSVKCVLLGPGVDTPGFFSGFFETLLQAIDLRADGRLHESSVTSPPMGWTGHGIPIRIPISGPGNSSATPLMRMTTLHARDQRSREVESSRLSGSFILNNGQLTSESASLIELNDLVIYTIDCRRGFTVWDDVCIELSEVVKVLTPQQSLLILGLCRKDADANDLVSAAEVVHELGGVDDGPLALVRTSWRVWCTVCDGKQYTNLNEIFQWAFIDIYSKRLPEARGNLSSIWRRFSHFF